MKHGKHYVDAAKQVDFTKLYDMNEALELACKTASAKFDETVELHVRLGVDETDCPMWHLLRWQSRWCCG